MNMASGTTARWAKVALIGLCALGVNAHAQRGGGSGGSGGSGEPPDYGDLIVLERDADGVPVLTGNLCQQPLAVPGITLPAVGSTPECVPDSPTSSCRIPVDPATCAIVPGYESYAQEVDFGRTNEARSATSVLDSQLTDAIVELSIADCVTLDPAGRLVTSTVKDEAVTSTEIDSPLKNLAIYRQLMLKGYLGADVSPLVLPSPMLDTAARSLGAAADKAGKVGVDLVVYLNQILGLTDPTVTTVLPKKCIDVREEVNGTVQLVRKCFLDYGPSGGAYAFNRLTNFQSLPLPAYIPGDGPQAGTFEHLAVLDPVTPTFTIARDAILDAVPALAAQSSLMASSIAGFAQAADDTRAVIDFMHNWAVPAGYATPIPCVASERDTYDVSISEKSGLQVPRRMVAGTEGREFTVVVANAGPDIADGVLTLEAVDATGAAVPTFPRSISFTLLPSVSQTWTEGFSIDYGTTITWTATAAAPYDANPANNAMTATTRVIGVRGGGEVSH